jgi:hypothetical protein
MGFLRRLFGRPKVTEADNPVTPVVHTGRATAEDTQSATQKTIKWPEISAAALNTVLDHWRETFGDVSECRAWSWSTSAEGTRISLHIEKHMWLDDDEKVDGEISLLYSPSDLAEAAGAAKQAPPDHRVIAYHLGKYCEIKGYDQERAADIFMKFQNVLNNYPRLFHQEVPALGLVQAYAVENHYQAQTLKGKTARFACCRCSQWQTGRVPSDADAYHAIQCVSCSATNYLVLYKLGGPGARRTGYVIFALDNMPAQFLAYMQPAEGFIDPRTLTSAMSGETPRPESFIKAQVTLAQQRNPGHVRCNTVADLDAILNEIARLGVQDARIPEENVAPELRPLLRTFISGTRQLGTGNYIAAIETLGPLAAQAPDFAAAKVNLASALRQSGRPRDALLELSKAQMLAPHDPDVWIGLGLTHNDLGFKDQAVDAFRKALKEEPYNVAALLSLGRVYVDMGHLTGSEQYLQQATQCMEQAINFGRVMNPNIRQLWWPELTELNFQYARVRTAQRRWNDAILHLKKCEKTDPAQVHRYRSMMQDVRRKAGT